MLESEPPTRAAQPGLHLVHDQQRLALVAQLAHAVQVFTRCGVDATLTLHRFEQHGRDAVATLKLGQARGIALLVPARAGVSVAEYAPNLVKKTIVGAGHSEKAQIRMMIGVLLPKADPQSEDAADALAIAVTHAHHRSSVLLRVAAR